MNDNDHEHEERDVGRKSIVVYNVNKVLYNKHTCL
jgi:hypothetical protein